MRRLSPPDAPQLLVGSTTGDDAAVWQLDDDRALVVTADFITPVVDDARAWGRVAATNAVSDIYAMGARPLLALNLVGWNVDELGTDLLGDVLAGGLDVATAEGFVVAGGHTVDDPEPKYGMAVVGEVDPAKMLTNAGLRVGDTLILSKPLGIGVITTALKRGLASESVVQSAITEMCRSNAFASTVAVAHGAKGCTDVTGFGLLGHLGRMAQESGVTVEIATEAVQLLEGALELAEAGAVPGGTDRNREWIERSLEIGPDVPDLLVTMLADAQTSGGLVFGLAHDEVDAAISELVAEGHQPSVIGTVTGVASDSVQQIRLL